MALTKARLLRHDFPVHGKLWPATKGPLILEHFSLISTPNMTSRRFHRATEVIPHRPRWKSRRPLGFQTYSNKHKQGDARGTREVRRGTSCNLFHRTVPRSFSHYLSPKISEPPKNPSGQVRSAEVPP